MTYEDYLKFCEERGYNERQIWPRWTAKATRKFIGGPEGTQDEYLTGLVDRLTIDWQAKEFVTILDSLKDFAHHFEESAALETLGEDYFA